MEHDVEDRLDDEDDDDAEADSTFQTSADAEDRPLSSSRESAVNEYDGDEVPASCGAASGGSRRSGILTPSPASSTRLPVVEIQSLGDEDDEDALEDAGMSVWN